MIGSRCQVSLTPNTNPSLSPHKEHIHYNFCGEQDRSGIYGGHIVFAVVFKSPLTKVDLLRFHECPIIRVLLGVVVKS